MDTLSLKFCLPERNKIRLISIILIWFFGALSGVLLIAASNMNSILYSVRFEKLNMLAYLVLFCAPSFMSVLLFRFCNFYFLLPLVFLKAFLLVSCGFAVRLAYEGAGWLVSTLMLSANYLECCFLFSLWCYQACGGEKIGQVALLSLCSVVFVGSIQYYIVLPFVDSLLNF